MAKSSVFVTHPKTKHSTKPSPKEAWHHAARKTGQFHFLRRNKSYTELPPGPENFIVRTPYPVAPSNLDRESQ